ncbi:unnamed protein product [Closterium sp. Naga37s-1]|nr:unnamed protein product [Closterium sp. Naga37s-1]
MPVAENSRLYAPTRSSLAKTRAVSPPSQRRLSPAGSSGNGAQGSEPRAGSARSLSPNRTAAPAGIGLARASGARSREDQPASGGMGQHAEVSAETRRWSAGSSTARLPSPSSPPTSPRFTRRRDTSSPPSSPGLGPGRPSRRTDHARDGGHVALGRQGLAVMQGRRLSDSSSSVSVLGVVEEQAGDTGEGSRQGSVDAFEAMSNSSQISDSGSYSGSAPTAARNGHVYSTDAARQSRLSLEPRHGGQAARLATPADVDRYHESGRQFGQMLRGGAGPARIVSPVERAVAAELATLADSVTDADVYAPSPAAAALMSATDGLFSAASAYASASVPPPPGAPSPTPLYSLSAHQPVSSSPWPPTVVALARPPEAGLGGLDVRARLGRTLGYGSAGGGGKAGGRWATMESSIEGQGRERQHQQQQQQPTKDAKELARSLLLQLSGGRKAPLGGGAPQVIAVRDRSGGEAAQRDSGASGMPAAVHGDGMSGQRQGVEGATSAFAGRGAVTGREAEQGEVDSIMTQRGAYNEKKRGDTERTGGGVMGGASFDDDVMVMAGEDEQHEEKAAWRQPWSQRRLQHDDVPPSPPPLLQQKQQEQEQQEEEEKLEHEQGLRQVELQEHLQKQISLQQQIELQQQEEDRSEEAEAESTEEESEERLVRMRAEEQAEQQRQQKLPSQPSLSQQQQGQQQGAAGGSPVSTLDVALSKGSPSTDAGEEEGGLALHARMHALADAHWLAVDASQAEEMAVEEDMEKRGGAEEEAEACREAARVWGDEPCVPAQQALPLLHTQGDKAPDSSLLAPANPPPASPLTTAVTPAAGPLQPPLSAPPPALPLPPLESLSTVDLGTLAFVPSPAGMEEDLEYIRYVLVAAGFANRSLPPAASPAAPISAAVFEVLEAEFLSLDGIIVDPANPLGPVTGQAASGGKAGGPNASSPEATADGLSESESLPSDAAPAFSSPALPANYPDERRQFRLLFDAVNEALGRRLVPFLLPSQPWQHLHAARSAPLRKRPAGRRLLQEVWAEIHSWAVPMSDDVFDTLDDLARRDLWKGVDTWINKDKAVDDEVPDVVFQLEEVLMGELIGEMCADWMEIGRRKQRGRDGMLELMDGGKHHGGGSDVFIAGKDGGKAGVVAVEEKESGSARGSPIANMIRYSIDSYNKPIPAVLEIPSKEHPYDPNQDSILSRVKHMFASSESVSDSRV